MVAPRESTGPQSQVWIDQQLCTGDGLCVQYAPEVFQLDVDGLAYIQDATGNLLHDPGARTGVPAGLTADVANAVAECPGCCIHLVPAGPDQSRQPDS